MKVLLTNDDGIHAEGLQALRTELLAVDGVELVTIAPDGNRSATARSITTRRPLWVEEVDFGDGTVGYATDGTPVDCVRLAQLGVVPGFEAEMVVSGINHGANLGDDITYSGTVAAAFEGVILGLPALAVSQQSSAREMDFRFGRDFDFTVAARFAARIVDEVEDVPLPPGTLINVNVPAGEIGGVEVATLGKRIYRDQLKLTDEDGPRRRYWIYGTDPGFHDEPGTDLAAIAAGHIAVTPLHYDLTAAHHLDALRLHPQVAFRFVGPGEAIPSADLIVLPGSKAVQADLAWLREQGWETAIRRHLRYGGRLIGIGRALLPEVEPRLQTARSVEQQREARAVDLVVDLGIGPLQYRHQLLLWRVNPAACSRWRRRSSARCRDRSPGVP